MLPIPVLGLALPDREHLKVHAPCRPWCFSGRTSSFVRGTPPQDDTAAYHNLFTIVRRPHDDD